MKDHVSPSQVSTFKRCARLWAYTALEGRREPPSGARHLGSSFHRAAEAANRSKLETRETMPIDEIEDRYSVAFRETDPSGIQWGEDKRDKTYDDGAAITRLFGATSARETQPVLMEQEVIVPPDEFDGLPIMCRIDLVDDQGRVIDYKTTSKAPSADSADDSDQLTAYAAAHRVQFGHLPSALVLDYFVRPLKQTPLGRRFPMPATRTSEQIGIWFEDIKAVTSQMRHSEGTGLFPYADPSSWWCGPKACGFFNECPGGAARRTQVAFPDLASEAPLTSQEALA